MSPLNAFIVFLHWSIQELVKYMLQADEVVDLHHPLQADSRQDAVTLSPSSSSTSQLATTTYDM